MAPEIQTVCIVDDDPSVLRGLARLVRSAGFEVETFASATMFLATRAGTGPGCILMDLRMPGMSGLELQEALLRAGHVGPILFMSGNGDIPATVRAMKAGAIDFLIKPFDEAQLMAAIRGALQRDASIRRERAQIEACRERFDSLTPREQEVCLRVARGMLNKQIAWDLGTAEKTVKVHRSRVMEKLRVESVVELARLVDKIGAPQSGSGAAS